jgi:hypothetical protein
MASMHPDESTNNEIILAKLQGRKRASTIINLNREGFDHGNWSHNLLRHIVPDRFHDRPDNYEDNARLLKPQRQA